MPQYLLYFFHIFIDAPPDRTPYSDMMPEDSTGPSIIVISRSFFICLSSGFLIKVQGEQRMKHSFLKTIF